jgi:hypothetical protein
MKIQFKDRKPRGDIYAIKRLGSRQTIDTMRDRLLAESVADLLAEETGVRHVVAKIQPRRSRIIYRTPEEWTLRNGRQVQLTPQDEKWLRAMGIARQ